MKKTSELIWEFAIALIAFAGAFTLVSNFFPAIPSYVFGGLFLLAFIFMLASFAWRLYEHQRPVTILNADMLIDTCDSPKLDIKVGFMSRDKVNISTFISIKFERQLDEQLKHIAKFHPMCFLKTTDNKEFITLDAGSYIETFGSIPVNIRENYSKEDFEDIDFLDKVKLGWNIVGHRTSWIKIPCHYQFILPELAKRYPTMVRRKKHDKETTK